MEDSNSAHIEKQENIIEEQNLIIQQKDSKLPSPWNLHFLADFYQPRCHGSHFVLGESSLSADAAGDPDGVRNRFAARPKMRGLDRTLPR